MNFFAAAIRYVYGGGAPVSSKPATISPDGAVSEPSAGEFDVTVAPGEGVQAAVDRCPRGGCVLLQPGTHEGPLVLTAGQEVHVFGRGRATLHFANGVVVMSEASRATMDGLIVWREAGGAIFNSRACVLIRSGRLRLQACDISSAASGAYCVCIEGGADPFLSACK